MPSDFEKPTVTEAGPQPELDRQSSAPTSRAEQAEIVASKPKILNEDELHGILYNEAKRMSRHACTYFWVALVASVLVSVVGIVFGKFSISANTGGWRSRGTMIADRHTQVKVTEVYREDLMTGDEAVWDDLINNIQPDWEGSDDDDDDDDGGGSRRVRRLRSDSSTTSFQRSVGKDAAQVHHLQPSSSDYSLVDPNPYNHSNARAMPSVADDVVRRLKNDPSLMPECNVEWYNSNDMTGMSRLWPVWKVRKPRSALDPDVLYQLCVAEENTQQALLDNGLCFGCKQGCLPPMSIVLYTRVLLGSRGMAMSCQELKAAWTPYAPETDDAWKTCVADMDAEYDAETGTMPQSCPAWFSTAFVNHDYDETGIASYTSTIFASLGDDDSVLEMFDIVDDFDRGKSNIEGVYDTQNGDFANEYANDALTRDMALAMGAAVIVAAAILTHTRSPFITVVGLLQIILSFPLAFFIYDIIFGYEFFPFLNFLGIFVIFGLGADNVFVATDKWKNARLEYPTATIEGIAAVALTDAAAAMFLTTITTAIAFFATAICPVAPIKMFAIFCGLLVLLDYVMNILLIFPALCIYDNAVIKNGGNANCCIRCCCCSKENDRLSEADASENGDSTVEGGRNSNSNDSDDDNSSFIRRILSGYFNILNYLRWPLFILVLVALGLSAAYASRLELPTSSDVRVLKDNVEYEQNWKWRQELLYDELERAEGSLAVVVWGVNADDTGDLDNPDSWTQLVLDESFDPSSTEGQEYLLQFCTDLMSEDFAAPVSANYTCSMIEFDQWLSVESQSNAPSDIYTAHCNNASSVPVPTSRFHECMSSWASSVLDKFVLSRDGIVTIMMVPFKSRVRYDDKYDRLDDEWNLIEDWMMDKNKNDAPEGLRRAYFSSEDFWWYDTNGQMLKTAYGSAGIALAAATAMLLFTSRSLVLTLFSTMTVGYVLMSVTATLVSMGWYLGFLESICFAILIGISCDFVLHFAHSYATLQGSVSRAVRTKFAIIRMGPSILAAGFTTICSAIIMNFTVITFFQKFGLILLMTILQAVVGAFIVFSSMVLCLGPTEPTYLYDKAVDRWCSPAVDDVRESSEPSEKANSDSSTPLAQHSAKASSSRNNEEEEEEEGERIGVGMRSIPTVGQGSGEDGQQE